MKTFVHRLFEKYKHSREVKLQEKRKSNILYCIKNSDIKYEELIPIGDEEYDRMEGILTALQ